jgi:outer membrane receptor for monomeric catechols
MNTFESTDVEEIKLINTTVPAQLNTSNLFNRRYVSACNQTFWCYYGQPRNIALTARMNF